MIRKRRLAAQKLVMLLMQLAHNVLIWSRRWLAAQAPRLGGCGIVRLVQEVWAVPASKQKQMISIARTALSLSEIFYKIFIVSLIFLYHIYAQSGTFEVRTRKPL